MATAPGMESEWGDPRQPIPLPRRRHRLVPPPVPLSPLIGRADELAAVSSLLTDQRARLVTLVGPGGIGKTRLALEVARRCAADLDGQIAWAPVAAATTPEAVIAALARAVGVAEAGASSPIESLKTALHDARLLVIVDNIEQALDAAPDLSGLLQACPDLSLLVTSRALLRVTGERPVDLQPLDTEPAPDGAGARSETPAAIQLFAQRAAAVAPAFNLTPTNTPAVAEICRRLDGLPLAIELAAARCALFQPAALLDRLDRRLPQLTSGRRDAPDRHRTMRDAIAWSYDLLGPAERSVFCCLGAFVGGCTVEAAESVCRAPGDGSGPPFPSDDVIAAVESLAEQSLLRVDPAPDGIGPTRLSLLETVHEFAVERLAASGDDGPRRRHAAYVLALALDAQPTYWGDAPGYPRTEIGAELGNLRAARDWAVAHGDADTALRLIGAMFDPHQMTGDDAREQWAWTRDALALPGGSDGARVAALISAAWVVHVGFDSCESHALARDAFALASRVGSELDIASAAAAFGITRLHTGDEAAARTLLDDALTVFRRLEAPGRAGWTLTHLAWLDCRNAVDEGGDPDALARAYANYDEALTCFRAIGHPRGIARSLHGLAYVTYKQRDLPRALATTQEVLALDWDQRWPVFNYLEDIADIAGRVGQADKAARLYGAADALRDQVGLPIQPPYRAEYERDVAVARRALGDEAFAAARDAGRALEPDHAVAEALAVTVAPAAASPLAPLSPREIEVLHLLAGGLSDREIADALFIGERTVNTHVSRLYAKLGVHSRAAAVANATALGLVRPASAPVMPE